MTKKTDMSETRTAETDMTETLEPEFLVIWLRRQACFSILHTWDCDTVKSNDQKIGESQSYLCNFGSRRLSYISLKSRPRVSLISVSIGLVRRGHISTRCSQSKSVISKTSLSNWHDPHSNLVTDSIFDFCDVIEQASIELYTFSTVDMKVDGP